MSAFKVWLPVVSCNGFAAVATLQRLSTLHPSQRSNAQKMDAARAISDATTEMLVADRKTEDHKAKLQLCLRDTLDLASNLSNPQTFLLCHSLQDVLYTHE